MTTQVQKNNFNVAFSATNPIVTSQAMEFSQSMEGFVSVRDVPLIIVPAQSGKLALIKEEYVNRDDVALRPSEMTEAARTTIGVGTVNYSTDERAVEAILSAADAAKIGYEYGADVPTLIPRVLAKKANIHIEGRFSSLWASGSWYRTVTGNASDSGSEGTTAMNRKFWTDATNDPIAAIMAEKEIFLLRTGLMPTNLRLGFRLFGTIARHPLVRAQVNAVIGGQTTATAFTAPATAAQLSQLIGMNVSVSWAIKNTSMVDGAPVNALIVNGDDALMTYDTPGEFRATSNNGGPPTVALTQSCGFARVAWDGVVPNGYSVRAAEAPRIGAGGSFTWILDLFQGYVIVDPLFGTFFDGMRG